MAKRYHSHATYTSRDERMDGSMIHEDRSAIANLPQNVIMKYYPGMPGQTPEVYDDSMHGIDRQMNQNQSQKMRQFKPKK